jgi:hypothetical protein
VVDISMGGVSVVITAAEAKRAEIPGPVTIDLEVFGTILGLQARTVHKTDAGRRRFTKNWEIGVRFVPGAEFDAMAPFLERYLRELHREGCLIHL